MLQIIQGLSLVALSAAFELPKDDSNGLQTPNSVSSKPADIALQEAIERNERMDALLQEMAPSVQTLSDEDLLLFVRTSEARRRQDLVLAATQALALNPALAEAWMARGRALASAGRCEEAEALLQEAQREPALLSQLSGLRGVLAFSYDRAGRPAQAAAHGRAHCLEILKEEPDEPRAVATVPAQALKTFERYEHAMIPDKGLEFLLEISEALQDHIHTESQSERPDPVLLHLRRSALAQLADQRDQGWEPRKDWMDWCLHHAGLETDPWWTQAALYAIGDTAQSVNLMSDPSKLITWCEGAIKTKRSGEVSRHLHTLLLRAENRRDHLTWRRHAEPGPVNSLTVLSADPSRLSPRTQRALYEIRREHPELKVSSRSPRPGDPPCLFSPQWMLFGADGSASAVFVGDGQRTQRAIMRRLSAED